MKSLLLLCICFFFYCNINAQQSNDINQSIITHVNFNASSQTTVSWVPKTSVSSYQIQYRTDLTENWQTAATGITDSFYMFTIPLQHPFEIQVSSEDGISSSGYLLAGNNIFDIDHLEKMLIIVTDSVFLELESLLNEYQFTLENELIESEVMVINQDELVMDVKDQIVNAYGEKEIDYILLLGHVPVPYAGNFAIDGHTPDHMGAWVADGYYGDLDGNWTDETVNNSQANREANKNIPDDGKFDQTYFPSDIEIPIGRVDFSNLPKLLQSENELTRRYLQRNIDYRSGRNKATRRAVVDNNFNSAEGFSQGAIKSYHTFLEPDSINYGDFSQCTSKDYLFTYGAGGGNYEGASGIINTNTLINDSIQSVFTTIFGSYFGDWDISNNLLRASLARGSSLINAWSGRPIWYFHHMAMGKTVGNVLLNTQNNNGNYFSQFGKGGCHTTLLGDPSLKMYYHEAVENIMVGQDQITWEYLSDDPELFGYTIYYLDDDTWKIINIGPRLEASIDFSEIPVEGSTTLLIRPVGYINNRSGSYYNEGIGKKVDLTLVSTVETENEYSIYPNPANDFIRISGPSDIGQVTIYNTHGQVVKMVTGQSTISIEELVSGVYTLQVDNSVSRFVKK